MPMKLLSPFQNKEKKDNELAKKILRIQEIEKLSTKANARIAQAEADFKDALKRNQEIWASEYETHLQKVKQMEAEINALEKRKEQALIPIELYKAEADKIMEEARIILGRAKETEEQNDYLQEKLETKLTEVGDRENKVKDEEQKQQIAREGIIAQQNSTREGIENLTKEIIKFHKKQQEEETSLLKRKEEVSLAEINLKGKIDKYKNNLEALKVWEIQLKDERDTLQREYDRLHK